MSTEPQETASEQVERLDHLVDSVLIDLEYALAQVRPTLDRQMNSANRSRIQRTIDALQRAIENVVLSRPGATP